MGFYRLAVEEDFEIQSDFFDYIPIQIRDMIDEQLDVTPIIVSHYRDITGQGLVECRNICRAYLSFAQAREDFIKGIEVYTEY